VKERLVTCNEEDTDGRARVTRDEERVWMVWNSQPTEFRDLSVGFGVFGALLRRYYSRDISASSAIEMYP